MTVGYYRFPDVDGISKYCRNTAEILPKCLRGGRWVVHDPTVTSKAFGGISAVFWCSIYIRKAVVADRYNYIAVITLLPTLL